MTRGTLKSPNPRNRKSISVINSKFLSAFSMNTLLAILKVADARRDVILAGGLNHRFPWRHLPPSPAPPRSSSKSRLACYVNWLDPCAGITEVRVRNPASVIFSGNCMSCVFDWNDLLCIYLDLLRFYWFTSFDSRFKVARLEFLGLIPPNFEH